MGEALAYNCIGVDLHTLASGDNGPDGDAVDHQLLTEAMHYHQRHLDAADDPGRFVALSNLGLAYSKAGRQAEAAQYHQDALRLAIQLQSVQAQSIAVGNLGLVGARQGDMSTAKACMDQHLHLSRNLKNRVAQTLACHQLGMLANKQGDFAGASQYLEEARQSAADTGERGMLKLVNCNLGIVQGNMRLGQVLSNVASQQQQQQQQF